jgi:membrane protease YdiL (CAAX protease family)
MKPMGPLPSVLFFGVPGLVIFALFSLAYPRLISMGVPIPWATYLCLWSPLIGMAIVVLVNFINSGKRFTEYFWMNSVSRKGYLIILVGLLVVQIFEASLGFTRPLLAQLPGFHVPEHYPDLFRVDTQFSIPMQQFLGMELSGNLYPLLFFGLWLLTNIFCEELLWRGYALARMELYFGKWAWLVNGLLWNIGIHFFFRWSFLTLIPISVIVPYLSQKYRSMIPGLIIHGVGNLLIYALLIPSYFA